MTQSMPAPDPTLHDSPKQSFTGLGFGLLLGASLSLAIGNPTQVDHTDHMATYLTQDLEQACEILMGSVVLGDLLKTPFTFPLSVDLESSCGAISQRARGLVSTDEIDERSQYRSMVLFSIYTTQLPDRTFRTIGAGGKFFTLSN